MSHNPALVSDPHTCISAVSVGSTHLDAISGGRIVLLIYIQCGAGSDTVACRRFQGILTASVFLSVSARRDRMCICNTAHMRYYKCSRQGSPPRHPASASRARNSLRVRSSLITEHLPVPVGGDHAGSREMYFSGATSAAAMLPLRGKIGLWPGFSYPVGSFNPRELQ